MTHIAPVESDMKGAVAPMAAPNSMPVSSAKIMPKNAAANPPDIHAAKSVSSAPSKPAPPNQPLIRKPARATPSEVRARNNRSLPVTFSRGSFSNAKMIALVLAHQRERPKAGKANCQRTTNPWLGATSLGLELA